MSTEAYTQSGQKYRRRDANFELLRVLAMAMVIVLHYLYHGGLLPSAGSPLTAGTVTGAFIESFCIAAVNIWVLISGYFLSQTGVSLRRILRLVAEVLFYTVAITGVMFMAGAGSGTYQGAYGLLEEYLFPISAEHYWFATAYVFMYLFAPLMNKGVLVLTRKQLKFTILGLLFWFSFIKSFVPVAFPTDDYGYGFGWFLTLYLIAAYMRKYDVRILNSGRGGLLVYAVSSALIFALKLAVHMVNLRTGRLASFYGTPFDYNYILCLTAALGIFSAFRYLKLKEGWLAQAVRFVAPLTFGVYLLHEHREIRDRWLVWVQDFIGPIPRENVPLLVLHIIASVIIVFLAGIMIDFIRGTMFRWFIRVMRDTKPGRCLRKLDDSIHRENGGRG
ncbi:MAG: acyltransferase [Lachnospiraceae bacterium]|nr:acyltransferase [Lachnospiraceae bacterium]